MQNAGNGKRSVILRMIPTGEGSGKIRSKKKSKEFVMLLKEPEMLQVK